MSLILPASVRLSAPPAFNPLEMPGLVYSLSTHNSDLMWQAADDETTLTNVTAAGQQVGRIQNLGEGAYTTSAASSARKPIYVTGGGTIDTGLFFNYSSSPDYMVVKESAGSMAKMFLEDRRFAIFMRLGTLGGLTETRYILDSSAAVSTVNNGIAVRRNSTGTISVFLLDGSGVAMVIHTTTSTLPGSANHSLLIMADGVNIYTKINSDAMESSALNEGLADTPMDGDLTIGVRRSAVSTTTSSFGGVIGSMYIFDRPISMNEYDSLTNYNPSLTSKYQGKRHPLALSLEPQQVSGLYINWDGADLSTMFEDTAGTTPILEPSDTAFGQTCALWKNKSGFRGSTRDASHATLGPTLRGTDYADNDSPFPALFWDGSDDRLDFTLQLGNYFSHYMLAVIKNLDSDYGSHFLSGSQYYVITGTDYPDDPGNQRFVWHGVGTSPPEVAVVNRDQDWNILESWRFGNLAATGCNGVFAAESNTMTGAGNANSMGPEKNPNFWMDGCIGEVVWFQGKPPADIISKVRRHLAVKWNIQNVTY